MRRQEIRSLADLAGEGTRVLTTLVRDTHIGIARRVFDAIGPVSKPVEAVHNVIAAATYYGVDRGVRASLHGAGELAAEVYSGDEDDPVESHPTVAGVIAALNGIYGDELANRGNGFALTMQIRDHGEPVAMNASAIAAAFPKADEFLRDRCHEVPFLPGAVYHFVATTAGPRAVGVVLGDHLVRPQSASRAGRSRQVPFDAAHGLTLTGLHHFDLLNHADIYDKLRDWLDQSAPRTESTG